MRRQRQATKPLDFPYGPRFMVYSTRYKAWYLARVVDHDGDKVRVRYAGWGSDEDEWLHRKSDRFDFEMGGKMMWKHVPGAAGAFIRLSSAPLPSGKLLETLPAGPKVQIRPDKRRKPRPQPEHEGGEELKPSIKTEPSAAFAAAAGACGVISNIRAFGAQRLSPSTVNAAAGNTSSAGQGSDAAADLPRGLQKGAGPTGTMTQPVLSDAPVQMATGPDGNGQPKVEVGGKRRHVAVEVAAGAEGEDQKAGSSGAADARVKRTRKAVKPVHCTPADGDGPLASLAHQDSVDPTSVASARRQGGVSSGDGQENLAPEGLTSKPVTGPLSRPPRHQSSRERGTLESSAAQQMLELQKQALTLELTETLQLAQKQRCALEGVSAQLDVMLLEAGMEGSTSPSPSVPQGQACTEQMNEVDAARHERLQIEAAFIQLQAGIEKRLGLLQQALLTTAMPSVEPLRVSSQIPGLPQLGDVVQPESVLPLVYEDA